MKKLYSLTVALISTGAIMAQNVGIGENNPASKATVKGNLSVGSGYSTTAAPSNGAIIQGPVGIGTPSPDGNALLDLTATDKGLLLPRVALVSTSNPISGTKPDGLMVYNTSTTGTYSTPGVYTWSTTANDWVRIITNTTLSGSLQPLTNSVGGGLGTFSYNGSAATQIGIANQGVVTGMIANDAVTTSQIAPNTITSADMGPNSVDLSSGVVTNVLPINRGGTNTNSLGSGGSIAYSNGTSYSFSPVGTNGQVLLSGGTGQPTWGQVTNAQLVNNSVTINTSGGITGGGTVALGGTLNLAGSGGTVTSVSATAPISVTNPTTAPNISMTQAGSGSNGWLSSTDWNTFSGKPSGTGTATQLAFWSGTNTLASDGNLYWDNTNKRLGIGTTAPVDKLDVRDAMSVNEIKFRNVGGGDDSDPYRLRKVMGVSNTNWLELQLNDDNNEEFRIYGNSCVGYGCGEYSGNLYHYFRADGTAWHAGTMNSAYVNTTDNAVGSGVTGIVVKAGDNNHRTASAAAVLSFLGITAPTGDNLGNHTATTTLNMNGQAITNISDAYVNGWWRNNNVNTGLYNQNTGRHFYSESGSYWTTASGNGMIFRNGHQGTITGYVYWDGTAGSNNFGLLSPNGNWRFRDDNSNTEAYGGFYFGAGYGQVLYDRDNTGYYWDMNNGSNINVATGNEWYANGWFRLNGAGGLYWQNYGGGWNMSDATWLRTYGNKPILASGGVAGYGNNGLGTPYGANPRMYANYDNVGGGGILVADDGGFFDYNDAWTEFRGSTGLTVRSDNTSWDMLYRMYTTSGAGPYDKRVAPDANAWGLLGASGNAWYQIWGYNFVNASTRESKKDITQVSGAVAAKVMEDLDKLHPYLYRYKIETETPEEGKEAKFRPGLHMGLLVDESPDYIQAQTFDGVDIYATASLGIAAAKVNREDIKEMKTALGWSGNTITVQSFGTLAVTTDEAFVSFDKDFIQQLNGTTPVVTLTGNKAAEMYITEKSDKGFRVKVNGSSSGLQIDYIAMAKVKTEAPTAADVPAETLSQMYVSAENKALAKANYLKPENTLEALKGKAQREAVVLQQQRQQEIYGNQQVVADPAKPVFDVAKDAAEKKRLAEEAKAKYTYVPEDAPRKNAGAPAAPGKE